MNYLKSKKWMFASLIITIGLFSCANETDVNDTNALEVEVFKVAEESTQKIYIFDMNDPDYNFEKPSAKIYTIAELNEAYPGLLEKNNFQNRSSSNIVASFTDRFGTTHKYTQADTQYSDDDVDTDFIEEYGVYPYNPYQYFYESHGGIPIGTMDEILENNVFPYLIAFGSPDIYDFDNDGLKELDKYFYGFIIPNQYQDNFRETVMNIFNPTYNDFNVELNMLPIFSFEPILPNYQQWWNFSYNPVVIKSRSKFLDLANPKNY
jgi:hypothetical protein